jgi:hydrogenase maturation factor
VVLGIMDKEHAEIKSGVKAGEQVIVTGQAGLPDGASITTKKPEEEAQNPNAKDPSDKQSPPEKSK